MFDHSYGITHPSQPDYLALFSGSTQGVTDDGWHQFTAPNLATALESSGKSFVGYIEKRSPRKHNPWESFPNAETFEKSFDDFPTNYTLLPAVSFVIPDLQHDMHDGSIKKADTWLKRHLGRFANWSKNNNSLLIVTFDEDDYHTKNHIFTLFYGSGVAAGRYISSVWQ